MFEGIKNYFRGRALRKFAAAEPTALLPLTDIRTVAVVLDVEDPGFNECKDDMLAFFKPYGIKVDVFFFDFRKLEKDELLLTSIQNTLLRNDLNWYGMPKPGTVIMGDRSYDLLISMCGKEDFTSHFTAAMMKARFKIGTKELPGNIFDMVVSGEGVRNIFQTIQEYLLKIQ